MPNLLDRLPGADWPHPNPQLQSAWDFARCGLLVFWIVPAIGSILLFVSIVLTWRAEFARIRTRRLNWWLLGWSIGAIVASGFGLHPGDACLGLINFLPYFGFFAAYSELIQSPQQLRQIAWLLAIATVPVILLGFGQLWLDWGGEIWIMGFPVHFWELVPGGNPPGRMGSVFGYATDLAAYLQAVFVLGIGLAIDTWERRELKDANARVPALIFLATLVVGCGSAIVLTSSRGAWGCAIGAILIFAIYRAWYWLLGLTAMAIALVFSSAYAPTPMKEPLRTIVPRYVWARITDEMYPDRPKAETRTAQWQFASQLIADRPLTGWGLQSFSELYRAHSGLWLGHPHNILLMLAASLGVPAMLVLTGIVGWICTRCTLLFLNFPSAWREFRTIFFTFGLAFIGLMSFNITDVTVLNIRLNALAWAILSSLYGVFYRSAAASDRP